MRKQISEKSILVILYLLGLILITFFASCSKEVSTQIVEKNIELSIDTRLPKDNNGYSVFNLYSTQTQNIHTISEVLE